MEINKAENTGDGRDEQGRWLPGVSGNEEGSKPMTEEEKEERRIRREAIKEKKEEYKKSLEEALPQISPALIKIATEGNVQAIKEIHDQVFGKPTQRIENINDPEVEKALDVLKDAIKNNNESRETGKTIQD